MAYLDDQNFPIIEIYIGKINEFETFIHIAKLSQVPNNSINLKVLVYRYK